MWTNRWADFLVNDVGELLLFVYGCSKSNVAPGQGFRIFRPHIFQFEVVQISSCSEVINLSIYLGRPSGRPAEAILLFHSTLFTIRDPSSREFSNPASCSRLSTKVVFCRPLFLVPSWGSHSTSLFAISSGCLQQCPASLILLCWIFVERGRRSP